MLQFKLDDLESDGGSKRESLAKEVESGNVEYKLKLVDPSEMRFQQLVTQLKWRLAEGAGEALYEIGVGDDGTLAGLEDKDMAASLDTLRRMCVSINARMVVLTRRMVSQTEAVTEVLVQALASSEKTELRVACLGGTQVGKSTLVAVLATGSLDDGHGSARTSVMRHPHELESGSTSCISQQVLGFDPQGALLNSDEAYAPTGGEIVEQSSKLMLLLDLCGQERFLKTTLYGLAAHAPDYALLMVAADAPASHVTRLHLKLSLALRLPIVAVLTRADACEGAALEHAASGVLAMLAEAGCAAPTRIRDATQLALLGPCAHDEGGGRGEEGGLGAARGGEAADERPAGSPDAGGACTPLFVVSATTGAGLPLLKQGMWRMRSRDWAAARTAPLLVSVDRCHPPSSDLVLQEDDPWANTPVQELPVPGSAPDGIVVSGTVLQGDVHAAPPHTPGEVRHYGAGSPPSKPRLGRPNGLPDALRAPRQTLLLGPDAHGRWSPVSVQSVKYKDLPVGRAEAGQTASFWLQQERGDSIKMRRGMVLREQGSEPPAAHWELEGRVDAVRLPTPIAAGAELVVHCLGVKQAARVLRVDAAGKAARLEEGGRAQLRLRFVYAAEFLLEGATFIFRESSGGSERLGVGVGVITKLA